MNANKFVSLKKQNIQAPKPQRVKPRPRVEVKKPASRVRTTIEPKYTPRSAKRPDEDERIEAAIEAELKPSGSPEGDYELNPLMTRHIEAELEDIMIKVWQALPDDPLNDAENVVVDKLRNAAGDDLRNVLGLNVTKRLLNVYNPLFVKIQFSGKPERQHLSRFLRRYNFTAFKRIGKVDMFAARMRSINDFDRICTDKNICCGDVKVTASPSYKFTKCPANLNTVFDDDAPESDKKSKTGGDIQKEKQDLVTVKTEPTEKTQSTIDKPKPTPNKTQPNIRKNQQINNITQTTTVKTEPIDVKTQLAPNKIQATPSETQTATNITPAALNKIQEAPNKTQAAPNKTQTDANITQTAPNKTQTATSKTQTVPNKTQSTGDKPKAIPNRTQPTTNKTQTIATKANEVKTSQITTKAEQVNVKVETKTTVETKPIVKTTPNTTQLESKPSATQAQPNKVTTAAKTNPNKPQANVTKSEVKAKIDNCEGKLTKTEIVKDIPAKTNVVSQQKAVPKKLSNIESIALSNIDSNEDIDAVNDDADMEEVDDSYILALISEGIVLDECSGSDDE